MDDMISRAAAIEAAIDGADDWDGGYNPSREEYIRKHMEDVPAVEAIPIEWLCQKVREEGERENVLHAEYIKELIWEWHQEEQEGDNGPR